MGEIGEYERSTRGLPRGKPERLERLERLEWVSDPIHSCFISTSQPSSFSPRNGVRGPWNGGKERPSRGEWRMSAGFVLRYKNSRSLKHQ